MPICLNYFEKKRGGTKDEKKDDVLENIVAFWYIDAMKNFGVFGEHGGVVAVSFIIIAAFVGIIAGFAGCKKYPDMSLVQIIDATNENNQKLILGTTSKPYKGQKFVPGKVGGVWQSTIMSEPKTFNQLIAERDASSSSIISMTTDYLVDFDMTRKEWTPRVATFSIETDEAADRLIVHYTIKDGLFWTYPASDDKVPVTSDDAVYWYNEIAGDPVFASSGLAQQQVTMKDGSVAHIDCVKIDDKRFDFVFPRIVADPLLSTNMSLCPSWIFKAAKEQQGADGVKGLFPSNVDVLSIPSCGKWYITEYVPGQRLVVSRNPNYWEVDANGTSNPYPQAQIFQIIGDANTEYLLFKQGRTESFSPTPENLANLIAGQSSGEYTVFNSEGSFSAQFIGFNQNPKNAQEPYYKWFCKKEFRQAMSCLINRTRIINQTYRGLAQPKYSFFPEVNPFYNADILLKYKFDTEKAETLLATCGMKRGKDGLLRDEEGNKVEFDLTIPSTSPTANDIAVIIMDEAQKAGIKINIRQTDFQKMVEMLTSTYDWESIIMGFGASVFPSQGSNVWPSYGNLHFWYPLQENPATQWEARVDYLYNEACYTQDKAKAKELWDEYQTILLEECPLIYLVRPRSFFAIRNKWDLRNVYFDNKDGARVEWAFLAE